MLLGHVLAGAPSLTRLRLLLLTEHQAGFVELVLHCRRLLLCCMAVQADNDWLRLTRFLLRLLLLLLHHDARIVLLLGAQEVVVHLNGRCTPVLFPVSDIRLWVLNARPHLVVVATLAECLSDV